MMTYATLMVVLEPGHANSAVLAIAGELAARFQARVIGIAACQPMQLTYGDGFVCGELIEQDRDEIVKELKESESEFRSALKTRAVALEWRSTITLTPISHHIANEARCADLVITRAESGLLLNKSREVNTGDLVMQAGRPVLIVPGGAGKLKLEKALVGWKDTRETRRAIADALPMLKEAAHVVVVGITKESGMAATCVELDDVVAWLRQHNVKAEPLASLSIDDDTTQLMAIAQDQKADIVVAGAYGHSRLREWILGGVTRDLLLCADCCSLISH
ncbi:universal stress protein [Undibacterium sp. TJN25]|uniref:universal stress protein n=1 Tax=Undibacterium sp. TJN25 TaxID=3413056 RepID=UPI003BF33CA4